MKSRKNQRRIEAEKRQEKRQARSPEQQLELLNNKLGKDQGAKKERARLLKQIESRVQ